MLYLKPHTGIRYKITENVDAATLEVLGTFYDSPVTNKGQLTPEKPGVHFKADGVEIDRPHLWMWDTPDDYEVNDLLIVGDRYFIVYEPQQIWDAEPITAHRCVIVGETDPQLAQESNQDL